MKVGKLDDFLDLFKVKRWTSLYPIIIQKDRRFCGVFNWLS